ncbi:putative protease [Triangularia setosa]|uniref:intramembrane prenyl-peptidase Rce1 n=1 Tax=Triangularia setosa TaxID=2587417 RepID=A0AAN7A8H2_9PEZI|nr:putative protease [Podospora setosa]
MPALGNVFKKFNPWHKEEEPLPPPFTPSTAYLFLAFYALIYFIPFYLSPTTRPSPTLSRDAPSVIRSRIRSVSLSCALCTLTTSLILSRYAALSPSATLHLLGVYPLALIPAVKILLLTALLFLGPLYSYFIVEKGYKPWLTLQPLRETLTEWTDYRNYIAGPVTEEILFRSSSLPLLLLSRAPLSGTIFLSPIIFGLAHIHHFYEFRLTHPAVPISASFVRSVFQLGYTTLFGAYANFLFLRTGSLLGVCAVHTLCNCMGLPQIWGRVEDENGEKKRNRLWTVGYYLLLITGAWTWYGNLWGLSESVETGLVGVDQW